MMTRTTGRSIPLDVLNSLALIVLIVLIIVGFTKLSDTSTKAKTAAGQASTFAQQTRALALDVQAHDQQTRALALAIQKNRVALIRASCEQQNARHRNTVRELERIIRRTERVAPPLRRAQIRGSRASTLLLINALAPHQKCSLVVKHATGVK